MIQRIQTLFLLLAVLSIGGLAVLPFLSSSQAASQSGFFSDGIYDVHDHISFLVIFSLAAVLALVSLFSYSTRKRQLQLNTWSRWLVLAGFAVVFALLFINDAAVLSAGFTPGAGLLMPPAFWIFSILASRNIQKDENLIKSMDRLR